MDNKKIEDVILLIENKDYIDKDIERIISSLTLDEKKAIERYYEQKNIEIKQDIEQYRIKIETIRDKIYKLRKRS